jgi:hypothetical protein
VTDSPVDHSRPRATFVALLVLCAVALRLWRVRVGLPDFLEEAIPLRIALGMKDAASGRIDWNPHQFNYPSLSVYAHFAVQQLVYAAQFASGHARNWADYLLAFDLDPSPMVIAARLFGIACDAALVIGVVRVGERLRRAMTLDAGALAGAEFIAGALVAVSPILVITSSSIFCDSLMAALAVWAIERMFAWYARPNGPASCAPPCSSGSRRERSTRRACSSCRSPC